MDREVDWGFVNFVYCMELILCYYLLLCIVRYVDKLEMLIIFNVYYKIYVKILVIDGGY